VGHKVDHLARGEVLPGFLVVFFVELADQLFLRLDSGRQKYYRSEIFKKDESMKHVAFVLTILCAVCVSRSVIAAPVPIDPTRVSVGTIFDNNLDGDFGTFTLRSGALAALQQGNVNSGNPVGRERIGFISFRLEDYASVSSYVVDIEGTGGVTTSTGPFDIIVSTIEVGQGSGPEDLGSPTKKFFERVTFQERQSRLLTFDITDPFNQAITRRTRTSDRLALMFEVDKTPADLPNVTNGGWSRGFRFQGGEFEVGPAPSPVPLPAAAPLFLAGLAGFGLIARNKHSR